MIALGAALAHPGRAAAELKTWTGAAGSWSDAGNWEPPGPPQAADEVAIASGSVTLAVDATVAGLTLSGGVLTGSGTLTVSGPLVWTGGTMSGSGSTVAMAGMDLGGANKSLDGRSVVLSGGSAALSGSGSFISMRNGATFTNQAMLELEDDGGLTNNQGFFHGGSGGGSFINHGTLRKLAGNSGATRFAGIPFDNIGTVEVLSGELHFSGGYTQTAGVTRLVEATLTSETPLLINGGTLGGAGIVRADVSSVGDVGPGLPAGILQIDGSHTQRGGGTFTVELGGAEPGSEYDRLAVAGAANLAGALDIRLIDGFAPSLGQQFEVLTYASRSGAFTSVSGLDLGGGLALEPSYGATSLVLIVVADAPDPTATETLAPTPTATPPALPTSTATSAPPASVTQTATPIVSGCAGDCDGDGVVRINELIIAVNLALRDEPAGSCSAVDANGDNRVTVDELIAAVAGSLAACGP